MFDPIYEDLRREVGLDLQSKRILVPGAGLGRLVFELTLPNPRHGGMGHLVRGNEVSYHQLFASAFILNQTTRSEQYTLYPFATSFSNQFSRSNQLRQARVPDLCPCEHVISLEQPLSGSQEADGLGRRFGESSMSAGDFVEIYGPSHLSHAADDDAHGAKDVEEYFDVVITLFFLDTARDPLDYIETIAYCLKPGGIWINLGPLLWHYDTESTGNGPDVTAKEPSDLESEAGQNGERQRRKPKQTDYGSVELSCEEIVALIEQAGFEIEKQEIRPPTGYVQDSESLLQNLYRPVHFVARRR